MSATEQVVDEATNDGDAQPSETDADVDVDAVDAMTLREAARHDAVKLGIVMLGVGFKVYRTLRSGSLKARSTLAAGIAAVGAFVVSSATAIATALLVGVLTAALSLVALRLVSR